MDSRKRAILIFVLVSVVLLLIWYFTQEANEAPVLSTPKQTAEKVKNYQQRRPELRAESKQNSKPVEMESIDGNLWAKALAADQKCRASLQKILPNYELIDVRHPFYAKPEMVLELALQLIQKVMAPKLDADYYKAMMMMLDRSQQVGDAAAIYQSLHQLDSCRDQQVLDFFDNIIKLAQTAAWSRQHKQRIVNLLGKKLLSIQQDFFNTNDLLLFLDIGQKLAAYQLIGVLNRDYFIALEEQLLKERESFEQIINSLELTPEEKWNGLKLHMKRLQDLGKEITFVFEQAIENQQEQTEH